MVIQRGWKILSDNGSTSASSTDANRSPAGLQSSSDDSCSTHSMATCVASPPPPPPPPPPPAPVKNEVSVIGGTASVDTMKFVTTPQLAETTLQRLKQRMGNDVIANGATSSDCAMRSLELLRISIQSAFDTEIDIVIKRFVESYFKPALKNLKENLGENAVTDDTLQKMCCVLLENAKSQYSSFRTKTHYAVTSNVMVGDSDGQTTARVALKRPTIKSLNVNEYTKRMFSQVTGTMPTTINRLPSHSNVKTKVGAMTVPLAQNKFPLNLTSVRRQIYWNTANISSETKFVLDVQANQAFGFASGGTERLASKHPELIRYLPDSEDRDWLIGQNIISEQNRNSRFLFLIHDEVCKLQQNHESYRTKTNIDLSVMHNFTVPDFMIHKMRLFFVDLNIKSRGLITNSFSVGSAGGGTSAASTSISNSHLRNALLQGLQQANNATKLIAVSEASNNNNTVTTTTTTEVTKLSKHSALSSSHATLTALLNNSSAAIGSSEKTSTASSNKMRK